MIGTSKVEYYFIRICIIGLHYLAPLCLLYCALVVALYGFEVAFTSPFPLIVEGLALAESLFFLLVFVPYSHHLQREANHPPTPSKAERQELFQLCQANITDCEAYLREWFLGADPREIKRENVKEFFLWAFFNRGGPPGDDNEELEEYVGATEGLLGRSIEPGRGNAECLRLTLDRVDMLHRSLVWYFCVGFVDFLTYMRMLFLGFQFHRTALSRFFALFPFRPQSLFTGYRSPAKYTTYWYRPHTSKTKLPIVFIHGIGIGLYPYTNFLKEINSIGGLDNQDPNEQIGILAIEIMPVSFRITHHAVGRTELTEEINQILTQEFGPDQNFVLASHSYGTIISAHLINTPSVAKRISSIVLIDPVCILLHLPDVAYNFTRRQPKEANEHQLYYFASMDMGVSHTLGRHFFWNENILWKQDFGSRPVTVSLSGRDLIVDTEAVGRYLSTEPGEGKLQSGSQRGSDTLIGVTPPSESQDRNGLRSRSRDEIVPSIRVGVEDEEWKYRPWKGTGIDVMWFKELDHAQVFDKPATRGRIIGAIREYCEVVSEED